MRAILFLLVAIALDVSAAWCDQATVKWGEVRRDDFRKADEIGDPNAAAVVLADIGRVFFSGEFDLTFERHVRILLLTEGAYDEWGTIEIPYYAHEDHQKVSHIDGSTYRATSGGTVDRLPLDKRTIFVEDVLDDRYKRVRFTMPGLAPGCIIEYRYTLTSDNPTFLQEWAFQTSEPTLWSEFSAEIPVVLNYKIATQGVLRFDVDESSEGQWPLGLEFEEMARINHLGTTTRRFAIRDVPALRPEPYMTTLDDYRARVRFQLSEYEFPGMAPQTFLPSWSELAHDLMEDRAVGANFGRKLGKREIERTAEALTEGLRDPEAKLRALYDYVRTTIVWDETHTVFAERELGELIESKRGSSGEIALLLTDLLRSSGVDAHPALLSTRDHGCVIQAYPIVTQFNTGMTYVRIGTRDWLLDATDRNRPINLLPIAALNDLVWVVDVDDPKWLSIARPGLHHREIVVSATVSPDGAISGNFRAMHGGYSALEERDALDDLHSKQDRENWIREGWFAGFEDVVIDSFEIGNHDALSSPLAILCSFTIGSRDSDDAGILFVPAVWTKAFAQNPFKSVERTFPVDLACGIDESYTLRLTIPEGYAAEELPDPIAYELPGGDARFQQAASVSGAQLEITSRLEIDRAVYAPEEYGALRALFEAAVTGHAQQVAIARTAAPAPTKAVTTK